MTSAKCIQKNIVSSTRDQLRREQYEQRQVPQISDHPVPRDSKRAIEVNYSQGRSNLRITVRNDESARDVRMIKPKVESNKYCKEKQVEP